MNNPILVPMTVSSTQVTYAMDVESSECSLSMTVGTSINYVRGHFQEKEATPTQETQILLPDDNFDALSKVTVNPIPSNYGLITWNGAYLTVS